MPKKIKIYLTVLIIMLATSCKTSPPEYLTAQKSCAILVGGLVPGFGSDQIAKEAQNFWFTINSTIATRLNENMQAKYKTHLLIVDPKDAASLDSLVAKSIASNQCNQLMQFETKVTNDNQGPNFQFIISVMSLKPTPNQPWYNYSRNSATTEFVYEKTYRYPRTPESMKSIKVNEFISTVVSDLEKANALDSIKR